MGFISKPFEELDVMDDFLMNAVATDTEVGEAFCKRVLSVLLGRKIGKVRIVAQHTLPAATPKHRGIRMDVEVEEYMEDNPLKPVNVYDLEPHLQKNLDLPKHNRFYQAKMDSRYMSRGDDDFSRMPDLFVVTILNFDPFGYNYMKYTIENHCVEVADLIYRDGLKFLYFYAGGIEGGSKEIRTMLRYLQHSTPDNARDKATRELHDYVSKVKVMPEVREGYMRYEEIIAYHRKDAKREDILELLEDYGEIPAQLIELLEKTNDKTLLKNYLKLAAQVSSIEEFMSRISS